MGNYLQEGDPDWGWEFIAEDFVFARLDEERAAVEALTGNDRRIALDRVTSLRQIATWHSTYVDRDGHSAARCFTCEPGHGFPCSTMRSLASLWQRHPDFILNWAWESDFLADEMRLGGFRRAYLARKESA